MVVVGGGGGDNGDDGDGDDGDDGDDGGITYYLKLEGRWREIEGDCV